MQIKTWMKIGLTWDYYVCGMQIIFPFIKKTMNNLNCCFSKSNF